MSKTRRAVAVCFHNYVPMYDSRYFQVLLGYFIQNLERCKDEFDMLYIIDSNWKTTASDVDKIEESLSGKVIILRADENLRYWDAYRTNLHRIKEESILFIDNDTVIYRKGVIDGIFRKVEEGYDVVSIFDTIGTLTERINQRWPIMGGQSKFCLYFFASRLDLLKSINGEWATLNYPIGTFIKELDYTTVEGDWVETLGELTFKMLDKGIKALEVPEDKTSIIIRDGEILKDGRGSNDLGYYHIRAGSSPAFLLTHRNFGDKETYLDHINGQPHSEYLRQFAWYWIANENPYFNVPKEDIYAVLNDCNIDHDLWMVYIKDFKEYHGL